MSNKTFTGVFFRIETSEKLKDDETHRISFVWSNIRSSLSNNLWGVSIFKIQGLNLYLTT